MVEYLIIAVVFVLAYAWIGYPLLLTLVKSNGRLQTTDPSSPEGSAAASDGLQGNSYSVFVVLSAHNEEKVIRQRLENIMDQQLPAGVSLRLLVGSDGSTDMTVSTALEFEMNYKNIKVFEYQEQRGKVAVLKELVAEAKSRRQGEEFARPRPPVLDAQDKTDGEGREEILVFTDANTEFEDGALEKLLRHFEDPKVGGVCGRLVFRDGEKGLPARSPDLDAQDKADGTSTTAPSPEGAYWRMETFLKERESALDSCLGANGAIYAVRAGCFWEDVPDNTIVDDFVIGMKVREQGKRMVYEPEAIAYEEFPDVQSEWGRRVRIGAGDYQALALCRKCLLPWYGLFAWSFSSHKVLRWLTPHMGISLLVLSCWLLGREVAGEVNVYSSAMMRTINHLVLLFLILLTSCAGVGRVMRDSEVRVARFFRLCDYFVTMHAALFVGFLRFCKGDLSGAWSRTPRAGNIYHGAGTSSDP